MLIRLAATLALLVCIACALPASAQDTHYWNEQYGPRAMMLSGVVIGSIHDMSATYYNPGALGYVEQPEVLLSANVYRFVREQQLPTELVVAAMPSDELTQRHLRFPFRDARRVAKAIPFELDEDLPVGLDHLLVVHEQALASPDQTDVLALACPREQVADRLNQLRQAGVEPRFLEAEGSVLANLSGPLALSDAGRMILDIGHKKTTATLLVDGRPVLQRSIPLAGAHLTRALARDLEIGQAEAERRKHDEGLFERTSTKPRSEGTADVLDRLSREVLRTIQAAVGDPLSPIAPSEVVLCGGTGQAARLDAYLEEQLGLRCSPLRVPVDAAGMDLFRDAGPGVFSVAAALALRAAPTTRVTRCDFRQQEFAYKADLSDLRRSIGFTAALAGVTLVLFIGSLLAGLFAAEQTVTALETNLASIVRQAFPDAPVQGDAFAALETRVQETRARADLLGVTNRGLSALNVLRDLSRAVPGDLGVMFTELNVEPRTIQARGYAKDFESAGSLRAQLEQLEWVQEVRLTDVVTDVRQGGKSFNLLIRVRQR